MQATPPAEHWQSRTTFVMALALAVLGLGNVWRFATLMGDNGGGPFFLSYLLCLVLVGVPLLIAEVLLGSHGRGSPFLTMTWATSTAGRSRLWGIVALFACFGGFLLLVLAIVLGGWLLAYAYHLQLGEFSAITLEDTASFFAGRLSSSGEFLGWQLVAGLVPALVVAAGVRRGIGLLAWLAVPLLLVLFAVLMDYALDYGDLAAAGERLFAWQTLDFHSGSFMAALVHATFTLSIGVGAAMTYGAYAPPKLPIARSVLAVTIFDVSMAVAAAVVLFPLLPVSNLLPSDGFALLFIAAPFSYGNLPFGDFYGALFFVTLFIALLGSAVALMEPVVAVLVQQFRLRRLWAAAMVAGAATAVSLLVTYRLGDSGDGGLLRSINDASTGWFIPMTVLLLAIFVGWRIPRSLLRRELEREPDILFELWYFLLRFVAAPVAAFAWIWLQVLPQL